MKGKFGMLVSVCSSMLLMACSSNTPSKTMEKAFDALIEEDYVGYVRNFYQEDTSEPEKTERGIQDFARMIQQNQENNEDEKLKSYKILKEEKSKTGKYYKITYQTVDADGTEKESSSYMTQDKEGNWKILMFGNDKLMKE